VELVTYGVQILQVLASVLLILVVLLQPGKSGDLGSIFGGGTSESVFGAAGAVPFLEKLTRGLAVLFMVSSLTLGFLATKGGTKSVVTDVAPQAVEQMVPFEEAPEGGAALPADEGTDAQTGEAAENTAPAEGGAQLKSEGESQEGEAPVEGADTSAPEAQESTQ